MPVQLLEGILAPFAGTSLGAAFVFFLKRGFSLAWRRGLSGFAGGVTTAASFFSLLLPAIEQAAGWRAWAFVPAGAGFCLGMAFLPVLDRAFPAAVFPEASSGLDGAGKMILAVTMHNLPEGMAVGIIFAGWRAGNAGVTLTAAWTLALAIAAQNIPEGAIVSLPLRAAGMKRGRAFLWGALSGAVEPVGGLAAALFTASLAPTMPWLLSFAAGAMISVVIGELIPEISDERGHGGEMCFAAGFTLMMALDVGMG